MRANEFTKPTVTESDHMDADQVLQYVKKTHAPDEFNIEYSITDHPAWELKNIPLSQLNLDPNGETPDPYNRTNWVDYDVVNDLIPKIAQVLKSKPIVVDSNGWIIDGNHRAMAAAEAGLTSVPALVPAQQDMAENKAAGINKMFNNLGDPVYANLQRVALLAMQGRQSEAAGRLQTVIKHADSAVQKKIIDAVNNIKPVTINGRVADSSTLDKSKQHNDWITNTFIPWVQSLLGHQDVTEAKTVEFEGLTLKVIKQDHELTVDALDEWGNKVLGHVKFNIGDGKELDPQDLRVDDKYQGQGIARVMYDYVKSLGYTINRSWDQTDAGAGFWNKHRGEDVRVWESFLGEANASAVQFQTASTDNYQSSFTVTAIADGKTVGHFSFFRDPETDDVHNQAEVTDDVQGKGYGKALLLKAIEVANDHGLGFQEDSQSLSRAQSRVYDSLYDAGWIVDADGYWFLTPEGEQELARISTMQQGMAENFADGRNPGRKEIDPDVYEDLSNSIIARTARQIVPTIRAKSTPEGYVYLSTQDGLSLVIGCNIAGGSIDINIGSQPMETTSSGPHKGAVTKIIEAVYQAAAKQYGAPIKQGTLSIDHDAGHGVWQHIAQKLGLQHDAYMVKENFADGKNPGRRGLSKRVGVNTKASVSSLRKTAKNSSGEKQRMSHWLANMKAGRAKAKRK